MKRTLLSLLAIAALAMPVRAVTLVNGSFEDLSGSYFNLADADRMNVTAADGWTISLNSPDWFWGEGPADLWQTPFGEHFAMGGATGLTGAAYREGISQEVADLLPGESYILSFSHSNGLYYNPDSGLYEGVGVAGGWQVLVDGVSVLLTSSTNDNSVAALEHSSDWQVSSVTFTASAATHEVNFVAWRTGDGSQGGTAPTFQFLDGVSVALVPEPSSIMLLGLAGMLGLHRRRH